MNFLSITFDDLNAFTFLKPQYGEILKTPNIDRVMAMGTTFENAFAQVAICNPSRASALSGLNPSLTRVHTQNEVWHDFVNPAATLPGVLKGGGYQTSLIGKIFHKDPPPSIAEVIADYVFRSPNSALENGPFTKPKPMEGSEENDRDYINVSEAIEVLNDAGDDPFAMFLGIHKPHIPWVVPQKYYDLYPLDEIEIPVLDGDLRDVPQFMKDLVSDHIQDQVVSAGDWKKLLQAYFASISYADAMLGRVLDTLEANGQLDDTAILLWTDHGYHLGDKDNWHKFTLWEEAARAPLVLSLPGAADNGQRVGQVVELVDIMPTVLDLLDLKAPPGLSGRSLLPFVNDPGRTDGGVAITTMYGSAAIRTNEYRFIRYEDGSTELYDLRNDPHEWHNLAGDPAWARAASRLELRLKTALEADGWHWVENVATTGTESAELFVLAKGSAPARGGAGDDTYFVNEASALVIERSNGGTDTVYASGSYTLPANVENLSSGRRGGGTLIGNEQANQIVGHKWLQGRGGDDIIVLTGPGRGEGGEGDDRVSGHNGYHFKDVLYGGAGDDHLNGWTGDDLLDGGSGNDVINGSSGIDTVSYAMAGSGVRVDLGIRGTQNTRGSGIDDIFKVENVNGSTRGDRITGSDVRNSLSGEAGNDILSGGKGGDVLMGGFGHDRLYGEAGNDLLTGASGNDVIDGSDGVDTASYATATATATAGVRVDLRITQAQATQGAGTDQLLNVESLIGTAYGDVFVGSNVANILVGEGGNDLLFGLAGNDGLIGGFGDDLLRGGLGNDQLKGDHGADILSGSDGYDQLIGGRGKDLMEGGLGRDVFTFNPGDSAGDHRFADVILDFSRFERDRINLSGIDARSASAADDAFSFIGIRSFSAKAGELRYELVNGALIVEGDVDGDRIADFAIRVSGLVQVGLADFVL